jgi:hypothetical protein
MKSLSMASGRELVARVVTAHRSGRSGAQLAEVPRDSDDTEHDHHVDADHRRPPDDVEDVVR